MDNPETSQPRTAVRLKKLLAYNGSQKHHTLHSFKQPAFGSCQTLFRSCQTQSDAAGKVSLAAAKFSLAAAKHWFGSCQTQVWMFFSFFFLLPPFVRHLSGALCLIDQTWFLSLWSPQTRDLCLQSHIRCSFWTDSGPEDRRINFDMRWHVL